MSVTQKTANGQSGINRVLFFSLLLCGITAAYAAYEMRGLHADGAFHLLSLILNQHFLFWETPRNVSYALQQWSTLLALKTGVTDIVTLARIYSFTMLVTPIAFIAMSYFVLPKEQKYLFIFPVFYYLAGVMSASFSAIGEAQLAGTYFWLLFFTILFFRTGTLSNLTVLALSCPIFFIHETYALMAPLLVAASCYRLIKSAARVDRLYFTVLTILFIAVTIVVLSFIFLPKSDYFQTRSQSYFAIVRSMDFLANYGYFNPPALLGLMAGFTLLVGAGFTKHFIRIQWVLVAMIWLAALVAGLSPLVSGRAFSPKLQFDARSYGPILIPLLVLLFTLACLWSAWAKMYFESRFVALVMLALAVGQCGWHIMATYEWRNYIAIFRSLLEQHHGLISRDEAIGALPLRIQHKVINMSWGWTYPTVSILLADSGKVQTIIANPGEPSWEPFDPRVLNDQLLGSPSFDFSAYLTALKQQPLVD